MAHCTKCFAKTIAQNRKVNCPICYFPLLYYCALCKEQFMSISSVRNHVIKGSTQISASTRCSKCYRSHFSTHCSFKNHELKCDASFRLDQEPSIILARCDHQPEPEAEPIEGNLYSKTITCLH